MTKIVQNQWVFVEKYNFYFFDFVLYDLKKKIFFFILGPQILVSKINLKTWKIFSNKK